MILCLTQADDSILIKRDYLRNGQLHIATNWHEVISLCQAQDEKFVLIIFYIFLLDHLQYLAYKVIFHIFDIETSIYFWCN